MLTFKDISDADIQATQSPALVINGDAEVVRAAHAMALALHCRIPSWPSCQAGVGNTSERFGDAKSANAADFLVRDGSGKICIVGEPNTGS